MAASTGSFGKERSPAREMIEIIGIPVQALAMRIVGIAVRGSPVQLS
jgi:hypothetical protein